MHAVFGGGALVVGRLPAGFGQAGGRGAGSLHRSAGSDHLGGTTLAAMLHALQEGHKTWREAGSDAAELLLAARGVDREDARAIATRKMPPLSD
ncbi:hypothetical protein [Ciceribacter azotifigens]|uniref:hypothetical protein n=1 Tax=Ciceribacter azotifigens TaxID=2069303 RepID=UPI003A84D271